MDHPAAPERPAARLVFADPLKVALTALVVVRHVAVIYGAVAPFHYVEPPRSTDVLGYRVLGVFALLNQAYFMGFFFLLSGYFSPASFDRKGLGLFLRDRLVRLGLPLVAFVLLSNPLAALGLWQMPVPLTHWTIPLTWYKAGEARSRKPRIRLVGAQPHGSQRAGAARCAIRC